MKLLSVRAENFRCFADLDLDLNVDGLIAVVGPNGAGKSTLFTAIEWALYGGGRGRTALPARRDGASASDRCFVEVEFEVGGRAYQVHRVDHKNARLTDLASGEVISTGLEETSRQVAARLGLTRDMFRGTFYARQREVQALDSTDEAKRREQVELLLGIERLRRATRHAQDAAKEQRHVVATLAAEAPDLGALRGEAQRLQEAAEEAGPAVKAAEQGVEDARAERKQTRTRLDKLRAQERESIGRRGRVTTAQEKSKQARQARDALSQQLADAERAGAQIAKLAPVGDQVEALAERERVMDLARADHERGDALRKQQRNALAAAAAAADQVARLVKVRGEDGKQLEDPEQLLAQIQSSEERIDLLRGQQREFAETRATLERQIKELEAQLAHGERAVVLDGQLAELDAAERDMEETVARWHELNARRTQQAEAIRHDTEHRDAVVAGTEEAACPTCKRAFDAGERDEIIEGYEQGLKQAAVALTRTEKELVRLKSAREPARTRTESLRKLAAERSSLGDDIVTDPDGLVSLRGQVETLREAAGEKENTETRAENECSQLVTRLPALRTSVRTSEEQRRLIADLEAQRVQAEREAHGYAEQLTKLGSNGYDASAHTQLRTELAAARDAAQRCAVLRGQADAVELLQRRVVEQQEAVVVAEAEEAQLQAAAAEVAVSEQALQEAEAACAAADAEFEQANEALIEANQRASADSEAVAAAQTRLKDGRERVAKLRDQRHELRVRDEVADALSAFREDASRRARPTLEHETALLLGQITRGRYNAVQLDDGYHLEIADVRELHPLRRYSGGEQDLAGLCLRLALSRTLARQRGAETGFILLDEVFGSQDTDRRRALLEQLHDIAGGEFRQAFVISHTDDVVEHCDLTFELSRDDFGISTAVGPRPSGQAAAAPAGALVQRPTSLDQPLTDSA